MWYDDEKGMESRCRARNPTESKNKSQDYYLKVRVGKDKGWGEVWKW